MVIGAWLLVAMALAAIMWRGNLFGVRAGSVAAGFDTPLAYPGYTWTRNGNAVTPEELGTIAGPDHCGWQSATFLTIGWPPGTASTTSARARQYIRDPKGVFGSRFRDRLVRNVTLPPDARPTGYRYGAIEIYLSPSDQDDAIYLLSPTDRERWPRSDPMTACE
jgi:hypothetical protein